MEDNSKYIIPEVGKVYENKNGFKYRCTGLRINACGNAAIMENLTSGWTCRVYGVKEYSDGTIEWAYSGGGFFAERNEQCKVG